MNFASGTVKRSPAKAGIFRLLSSCVVNFSALKKKKLLFTFQSSMKTFEFISSYDKHKQNYETHIFALLETFSFG